jgi:LPXTG-motif cell wall-anchored protein
LVCPTSTFPVEFGYCNFNLTHCGDNIHNCDETGIDCGGSCEPCTPGIIGRVIAFSGNGWPYLIILLLLFLFFFLARRRKKKEDLASGDAAQDDSNPAGGFA